MNLILKIKNTDFTASDKSSDRRAAKRRGGIIDKSRMAGATGLEPVIFPVTGEYVNQTTPRAHVPGAGIEPTLIAYETTLETNLLPGKIILIFRLNP